MSKTTAISKLSPAAARLLLAFLSMSAHESYDDVVARTGICDTATLSAARQQLRALGFVIDGPAGEHVVLHAQLPLEKKTC